MDLSCLEAKINLQTWVVLLDFLGLGAKVQDIDVLAGREAEQAAQPPDPGRWHVSSTVWPCFFYASIVALNKAQVEAMSEQWN